MPSDFFTRLVERTVRPGATVRPRLGSPFVPSPPEAVAPRAVARAEDHPPAGDVPAPPEREPDAWVEPPAAAATLDATAPSATGVRDRPRPAIRVAASAPGPDAGAHERPAQSVAATPADDSDAAGAARSRPGRGVAVEAGPRRPPRSPPRPDHRDGASTARTLRPLLPAVRRAERVERQAAPADADREPSAEPPVVRIDIGRVEVKATPPPAPAPNRVDSNLMSLTDYLGGRGRSRR